DELGRPQDSLKFVHVAGSKGKGSVCEMLASCLRECGYAVGMTTSPHLIDLRERIRVGGEMIGEREFQLVMSKVRDAAESLPKKLGQPTYFEAMIAAAFRHFADQAVDVVIAEVGLGGRLDATNVIEPELCLVSEIQLEHTDLLGETLAEIAAEKAGIFKPGVPAISVRQTEEAMDALRSRAEAVGVAVSVLGEDVEFTSRFEAAHGMGPHARVSVTTARSEYEHLAVPLPGEHQAPNCGLVLAALDRLKERGFDAPERDVARGLADTPRRGRLEIVHEQPRVLIDGAHTPESVRAVIQAIGASIKTDSTVLIFGCASDKQVGPMLDEIARGADKVIFTRSSDSQRSAEPAALASEYERRCEKMAQVEPTVRDAINAAARAVTREDLIVVTGSFLLAGEAKALLDAKRSRDAEAVSS
ncbi:MAG: folylpolyglutamate synthase/dihydrofolate synthase family protein, partial [Planctomycetota bacterium]